MENVWFVLGISGAGKSHFSAQVANELSFVHFEIDQYPHDGIDHFGFRTAWDHYFGTADASLLYSEISDRFCRLCRGAVLSFPSNLLACITAEHVVALRDKIKLVVLSGPPEVCRSSFWHREESATRSLPSDHWETNNLHLYAVLQQPWLAGRVINAFDSVGPCRTTIELLSQASGAV